MIGKTMVHEILVWLVIRMVGIPQQIERNVFRTFGHIFVIMFFFFFWRNSPQWVRASSFLRFLDHTQ